MQSKKEDLQDVTHHFLLVDSWRCGGGCCCCCLCCCGVGPSRLLHFLLATLNAASSKAQQLQLLLVQSDPRRVGFGRVDPRLAGVGRVDPRLAADKGGAHGARNLGFLLLGRLAMAELLELRLVDDPWRRLLAVSRVLLQHVLLLLAAMRLALVLCRHSRCRGKSLGGGL